MKQSPAHRRIQSCNLYFKCLMVYHLSQPLQIEALRVKAQAYDSILNILLIDKRTVSIRIVLPGSKPMRGSALGAGTGTGGRRWSRRLDRPQAWPRCRSGARSACWWWSPARENQSRFLVQSPFCEHLPLLLSRLSSGVALWVKEPTTEKSALDWIQTYDLSNMRPSLHTPWHNH